MELDSCGEASIKSLESNRVKVARREIWVQVQSTGLELSEMSGCVDGFFLRSARFGETRGGDAFLPTVKCYTFERCER